MIKIRTFYRGLATCVYSVVLVGIYPALPAASVVELCVVERQGVPRRGEPVTFAVSFPIGALRTAEQVRLVQGGKGVPAPADFPFASHFV